MPIKVFSCFSSGSKFGRGSFKEHFYEIILKLGHWLRVDVVKVSSIFSSGGHFVQLSGTILAYLVEGRNFSIFSRVSPTKHFCEIILNLVHWSMSRYHLKAFLFLALAAILFIGAEQF